MDRSWINAKQILPLAPIARRESLTPVYLLPFLLKLGFRIPCTLTSCPSQSAGLVVSAPGPLALVMAPKEADAHRVVLPTRERSAARAKRHHEPVDWEAIARKRARLLEWVYLNNDVPQDLQWLAPSPSERTSKRTWEAEMAIFRNMVLQRSGNDPGRSRLSWSSSSIGPPPGLELPGDVEVHAPPGHGHAASSSSIGPPPGLELPGDAEVHDPTGPGPAASSSSIGPPPGLELPGADEL